MKTLIIAIAVFTILACVWSLSAESNDESKYQYVETSDGQIKRIPQDQSDRAVILNIVLIAISVFAIIYQFA
jgi:hypothetical protein